jgi:hypothetical protein
MIAFPASVRVRLAVGCTDMRGDRDLVGALAYLAREGHGKPVRLFRKALDVPTPAGRRQAATAALDALNRDLGLSFGRTPSRF